MAWSFRSSTSNGGLSMTMSLQHGDCVAIAAIWLDGLASPTVADDSGVHTYTAIPGATTSNAALGAAFGGTTAYVKLFLLPRVDAPTGSYTLTMTNPGSTSQTLYAAYFIPPSVGVGQSDQGAGANASSGVPIGPSVTTTSAQEFLVGFILANNIISGAGSGWTGMSITTYVAWEYKLVTSTGTYQNTQGGSGSGPYVAAIASVSYVPATPSNISNGLDIFNDSGTKGRMSYNGKVLGPGGGSAAASHGQGFPTRQG